MQTLAEACEKTDWQIHAWCLIGNHFQFAARVEVRRAAETQNDFEPQPGDWCAGSEQFRQELECAPACRRFRVWLGAAR